MNRRERAEALLAELGAEPVQPVAHDPGEEEAAAWARSGALYLTGPAEAPSLCVAPLPHALEGSLWALRALAPHADLEGLDARLLGERAALAGLNRRGAISAGGSCRYLRASDAWIAPNLARPDDWHLVPAWLEAPVSSGDWEAVARHVATAGAEHWAQRARWLGLALGCMVPPSSEPERDSRVVEAGPTPVRPPWVLDLSSLWAGPLCAHLLGRCGARVTKVECSTRPDGARRGHPDFYRLMNAGKESVALDFSSSAGREGLARLIAGADIVLESSRPRALAQLGIDAEAWVTARPGRVWCSITGYGRRGEHSEWVAFGDDAAVSAGLIAGHAEAPLFVGDAIADPLTGVHSALATWAAWKNGGGRLLDIPLSEVVRGCLEGGAPSMARVVEERWVESQAGQRWPIAKPWARPRTGKSRPLGADTGAICAAPVRIADGSR